MCALKFTGDTFKEVLLFHLMFFSRFTSHYTWSTYVSLFQSVFRAYVTYTSLLESVSWSYVLYLCIPISFTFRAYVTYVSLFQSVSRAYVTYAYPYLSQFFGHMFMLMYPYFIHI